MSKRAGRPIRTSDCCRGVLLSVLHITCCQATRETYILQDDIGLTTSISRWHQSPELKSKHSSESVHSPPGAVAKVRAQQRLRHAEWQARMQPLDGRLRGYREQHLECTRGDSMPGPYVVMRIEDKAAGIGNELPGIITGLFLALLLERCLFVDFPFYNRHFAHELDFSWAHHAERLLHFGHDANATEHQPQRVPFGYDAIGETWLFKDLRKTFGQSYGVELFTDLDYKVALAQSNPYHKEFFARLFPTREVFAALAPFVLQLAPEYEREVQAFMGKRFRLYSIGIQIRRRKCNGDRHDLSCELRPSIEAYCQVAKSIQMTMGLHNDDVAFFLAADEPATYLQVAQILGEQHVIWTENGIAPTGLHSARGEFADVWNDAQNPGTVQSALIDMALLSHCDDLVVTMASSFGYVAAAWGGFPPVYMVYGEHTSSQNPYWYRAISSEPCFWQAKNMLRQVDARYSNRFRSNPFWMQYTQCHNDWS
ncbi:hypothetical protein CVIRNUC_009959 [Coccomyxa viridis]|uniref:Fucosyltransferase n=1 Tax=Coccomyxa viridis TaxID=1274662 RepID=A0AAV1IJW2_9CHLO|nr:hypothetical protein CVIRNUC_009959 [Coccomyxa viridis]